MAVIGFIRRFGLTTFGPLSISGANFLLSIALIPILPPDLYGLYAFCIVVIQFSYSLTNSLCCTPLSVNLNIRSYSRTHAFSSCLLASLLLSFLSSGILFYFLSYKLVELSTALVFALLVFLAVARWFLRSYFLATHRMHVSAMSDVAYSAMVILGACLIVFNPEDAFHRAATTLCLATFVAIVPLIVSLDVGFSFAGSLMRYREIWRTQSRWSLLGVLTTEATANSHVYIVTLLVGAAAYAPIAVATLVWRPVATVFSSMTLVERPVIARHLANGRLPDALQTTIAFRRTMIGILVLNAAAIGAIWLLWTEGIKSLEYSTSDLYLAVLLWLGVLMLRTLRVPSSVFVQAANEFKLLSRTSLLAAPVSMAATTVLVLLFGPIWSILGILLGEIAMTYGVLALEKKLQKNAR